MANDSAYSEMMSARISPFITEIMRKKHITGLSIALVDETGVLVSNAYGFANKATQQPAKVRSVYKIGSITKVFTGTAAMQLYEQGLLDIDKPVSEYLPEFSLRDPAADLSKITARSLMTHHSGLPGDWYADYWSDDPHAFRNVLDYLHESDPVFPPDTVFSYSNLATSVMGILIERLSQLSYQEYIEQRILAPLKMSDSATSPGKIDPELLSKAYAGAEEVEDPMLRDAPAGTILSNVQDMARFLAMLLNGGSYHEAKILQEQTLNEMLHPQNADVELDLGFRIGLNWFLTRPTLASAGRVFWHDGGTPHFFSILVGLPDVRLGVVVLSNSDGGMVNVGLIADEVLKQALAVKTGQSAAPRTAPPPRIQEAEHQNGDLPMGTFASGNGIVRVYRRSGKPRAELQGKQFALFPEQGDWYALKLLLLGFLPIKVASLDSLRLTVRQINGQKILGMQQYGLELPFGVEFSPIPIPNAWREAAGEYHLTNEGKLPPFSTLKLTLEDGILFLKTEARKLGKMVLVLQPVSDTESKILGFGRTGGLVVELLQQNGSRALKLLGMVFVIEG